MARRGNDEEAHLSTIIPLRSDIGVVLTKRQLAAHLDRSCRWIELKVADGMPSIPPTARYPHRRFRLVDVEAWLKDGRAKRATTVDRVAALEVQMASLTAMVDQLRMAR
jgi:hypothetical protein